jgi:hypothetical protein
MPEEYEIPPDEGPVPKPPIQLYRTTQSELNLNIGSLEKRLFMNLAIGQFLIAEK